MEYTEVPEICVNTCPIWPRRVDSAAIMTPVDVWPPIADNWLNVYLTPHRNLAY